MEETEAAITIHLVNLTNPMAMKGPYRDFFPVGPHTVRLDLTRVNLPGEVGGRQAQLLVAEKGVEVSRSGSALTVTVPSILDHEVVAIDL